jgi:hypothetical protein
VRAAETYTYDELVAIDTTVVCDSEIRDAYLETRYKIDRLEASAARLLVAVHHRGIALGDGASSTPAWVQCQTGQRFGEARASLEAGKACSRLPLVEKAWAQGEISASAARTICRGSRPGFEDVYADVEATLVGYAAAKDVRALDTVIAHYQCRVDALAGKEPADANGLMHSRVGNRWKTSADYDALSGLIVNEALNAAMDKPSAGDLRSLAKRRADASTFIHRFFLDHADLPVEGGERPHVSIVLDAVVDPAGAIQFETSTRSQQALSPAAIRKLLCEARLCGLLIDHKGVPLDVGRAVYRPSRRMRRAVAFRDRGCRFPGCGRQPGWCDVHHVLAWPEGETIFENLVLLCAFHHGLLHQPGWHATFDGTTFTVTNPDGRVVADP